MRHDAYDKKHVNILDGPAFDMHVGLANGKWVNIIRMKVTKTVIDEAVRGLVRADRIQNVLYRGVLGKAPVIFGDSGRRHLLPVPVIQQKAGVCPIISLRTTREGALSRAPRLRVYRSTRPPPRGDRRNDGKSLGR